MMNQPTDWGGLVDHTPGQIPKILNVDAVLHVNDRLLAILEKLKQGARVGGQVRAEKFRARKEQAEKTARTIWSLHPDLSCLAVARTITKRVDCVRQPVSERTIRRWIAPLRPSTP